MIGSTDSPSFLISNNSLVSSVPLLPIVPIVWPVWTVWPSVTKIDCWCPYTLNNLFSCLIIVSFPYPAKSSPTYITFPFATDLISWPSKPKISIPFLSADRLKNEVTSPSVGQSQFCKFFSFKAESFFDFLIDFFEYFSRITFGWSICIGSPYWN